MIGKTLVLILAVLAVSSNRSCLWPGDFSRQAVPAPQSVEEQQELEAVLTRWERTTACTESFRYEFRRWTYDPVFGPKEKCKTYSEGIVEISMPSNWYFRADKTLTYQPSRNSGDTPRYVKTSNTFDEEYAFDGNQFTYIDTQRREIIRTRLSSNTIRDLTVRLPSVYIDETCEFGEPLRWLSSIDRPELKRRYHIRLLPPAKHGKAYQIEFIPKVVSYEFTAAIVILDRKLCLPVAVTLFNPLGSQIRDRERTVYEFTQGDPRVHTCADFVVSRVELRPGWIVREHQWRAVSNTTNGQQDNSANGHHEATTK